MWKLFRKYMLHKLRIRRVSKPLHLKAKLERDLPYDFVENFNWRASFNSLLSKEQNKYQYNITYFYGGYFFWENDNPPKPTYY